MKITKNHFFWHLASENAIRIGWDFDSNIDVAYIGKPEELLKEVYKTASGLVITEGDVLEASKGNVTPAFEAFFTQVHTNTSHLDPDDVILCSMHSGSSEYLYVKDITEMVNS